MRQLLGDLLLKDDINRPRIEAALGNIIIEEQDRLAESLRSKFGAPSMAATELARSSVSFRFQGVFSGAVCVTGDERFCAERRIVSDKIDRALILRIDSRAPKSNKTSV